MVPEKAHTTGGTSCQQRDDLIRTCQPPVSDRRCEKWQGTEQDPDLLKVGAGRVAIEALAHTDEGQGAGSDARAYEGNHDALSEDDGRDLSLE